MNYSEKITESLEYLQEHERQQRQASLRDRIRFLRLLKSKLALSQQQAAVQLGSGLIYDLFQNEQKVISLTCFPYILNTSP